MGTSVSVSRKSWSSFRTVLALVLAAGPTGACRRASPPLPSSPPSATSQPPSEAPLAPPTDFYVLVWIESTPPGARVVRVSDGFVMARTPEIVEFLQSKKPVQVRIELDGYLPVTREVSAEADGKVTVSLEPTPKGKASGASKPRQSR
jgi:hypothetical protein